MNEHKRIGETFFPLLVAAGLSIRAANSLIRGRIYTIEQLETKTDNDLLRIKGLGRKTLNELRDFCAEHKDFVPKKKKTQLYRFSRRELFVYRERIINKRTLRSVAKDLKVTPERIRQMTFRIKEKISRNNQYVINQMKQGDQSG